VSIHAAVSMRNFARLTTFAERYGGPP
jgi:hypothetical protein